MTNNSFTTEAEELGKLRDEIDSIDQQIQQFVNQRAQCAQKVADVKEHFSKPGESVVFYRPEREAQVLRRVMERNTGPLPAEGVARLFREIMSQCLALEEPMKIAYLGPEGTFTQQAALKHFGHAVDCQSQGSIADVFREVEAGGANFGVVPVENSTEGVITHTLDSFVDSNLNICGEVALRIHHHFLLKEELLKEDNTSSKVELTKVYSHAQSLAQCRQWLDANWPGIERIAVSSNAEAARRAQSEEGAAAIASEAAAELYDLNIITANIEDMPDNTTRFLIIGPQTTDISGDDKTSLLVASKNEPGALYHVLAPFHEAGVSLTRIETRPSKSGTWNYIFFIDLEGHQNEEKVKKSMALVQQQCTDFKCLGSYPKAVL
ncbi:MAG: prephenate dehydratase [Oleispira sp.]|nr:prephenate dehydratase [Oleispira sp.]